MLRALKSWLFEEKRSIRKTERRFRPSIESLEDRITPISSVTTLGAGLTPTDLAQNLVGPNIAVSNVVYRGTNISAGIFRGGGNTIGLDNGVVLSNGNAGIIAGPYNAGLSTTGLGLGNGTDPDFPPVQPPLSDIVSLSFDFTPTASSAAVLTFVYGSDEYNSLIPNQDPIAVKLNGVALGVIPGTTIPITAGTINGNNNSSFFVNNAANPVNVNMDGFTKIFTIALPIIAGQTNHFEMKIADSGNNFNDSWLMLLGGTLGQESIRNLRPLRYVYQAATNSYVGNVTTVSLQFNLQGPTYLQFPSFPNRPTQVSLLSADGVSTKNGLPFRTVSNGGAVPINTPIRTSIRLSDPLQVPLGTMFLDFPITLTSAV